MLNNSVMRPLGFEISQETTSQINTNLKQLSDKLPQMPMNTGLDSSDEEEDKCDLSAVYEESSSSTITDSVSNMSEEDETRDPYAPTEPIDCSPLSTTYSVHIQSFSYNSDLKEYQEAAERAKSKFYTCLQDPPARRPSYATFMRVTKAIHIDDQYTNEQIRQCNYVPECVQKLWITYEFSKA
ncbi:unnamed protein product [Adineta ricciae]|nr:unnamed protein product [Adineta ricciae]